MEVLLELLPVLVPGAVPEEVLQVPVPVGALPVPAQEL